MDLPERPPAPGRPYPGRVFAVKGLFVSGAVLALGIPTVAVGLLTVTVASITGGQGTPAGAGPGGTVSAPVASPEAIAEIPPGLLAVYRDAAVSCPGLAWTVLAAIGDIETDHGRHAGSTLTANGDVVPPIVGPALDGTAGTAAIAAPAGGSPWHDDPVWDHPVGPMQFLTSTWTAWARDADGDGIASPHNMFDATWTAAAYLCGRDGVLDDLDAAIGSYNRSRVYRDLVLATAERYGGLTDTLAPAPGAATPDVLAAVLANPNLTLSGPARRDLELGLVDGRLVVVLDEIGRRFRVGVGVIRTGHSQCVGGGDRVGRPSCSISNHWYGRAVDLGTVDGDPVSPTNRSARLLAEWLIGLPAGVGPDEIGVPWADLAPLAGVFSDAQHQGHLHVGFET